MKSRFILPTPEEERQIAESIASDPDAAPDMSHDQPGIVPRPDLSFTARKTESLELDIDKDVVTHFRSQGSDWKKQINRALRRAAGL